MAKRISHKFLALMAVSSSLGLVLTGCSGSPGGPPSTTGAEPAAAEPAAESLQEVDLLVAPVAYEPVYIGIDQGIFEKHGLDINIVEGGTAAQAIPQLISGEVDIAHTGGVSHIAAVAQGMPVKAIAGSLNADSSIVTSGLLVKEDSDIQSYKDLEGKTVGLQGLKETTNLGTMLGVESEGGDPDLVDFVQVPLPGLNDALVKDQVDAVYSISSFYPAGLAMGFRHLGAPANEFMDGGASALWFTTTDYLGENEEIVTKFQAAMEEATTYAMENHDAVVETQIERTNQDPDYLKNAPAQNLDWRIDRGGMQATIDGLVKYGFIESEPTFEDVVWDGAPLVED